MVWGTCGHAFHLQCITKWLSAQAEQVPDLHVAAAASVVLLAAERLCLAEVSFLSAELGIQGCDHPERSATATRRGLMSFRWQPLCWVGKG